jgi:hypothetical protein
MSLAAMRLDPPSNLAARGPWVTVRAIRHATRFQANPALPPYHLTPWRQRRVPQRRVRRGFQVRKFGLGFARRRSARRERELQMSDRSWTISGVNAGDTFFEQVVSVDRIAESEVKELLRRLASRHIAEADVVACSLDSDYRAETLGLSDLSDGSYGFSTNAEFPIYYTAVLGEVAASEEAKDDEPEEDED